MGVTEKGLKSMLGTIEGLKGQVDRVRRTLDQFADEINVVLDGNLVRSDDELPPDSSNDDPGLAGGNRGA